MAKRRRIERRRPAPLPTDRIPRYRGAARRFAPKGGGAYRPFFGPQPYKLFTHPSMNLSGLFPYVRSDTKYQTWINIFNGSDQANTICVDFVQPTGFLLKSVTKSLNPFECTRLNEANFTGAVYVWASGYFVVHSNVEIGDNAGNGIALDQTADGSDYFEFFQLAAEDYGPGKARTSLIALSYDNDNPIFLLYSFGYRPCSGGWAAKEEFEVELPPSGGLCLQPRDKLRVPYAETLVEGETAPFPQGYQTRWYTTAQFLEDSAANSISLLNHRPPRHPYSTAGGKYGTPELYYVYLVDIQDDQATRTDLIYVKHTNYGLRAGKVSFPIHFYDKSGNEVGAPASGPLTITLARDAGNPASFQLISPSQMIGKSFAGSIWIETPKDANGRPYQYDTGIVQAVVRRRAPGKWTALGEASHVGGGPPQLVPLANVIPYVSNKDKKWIYQLTLFYPKATYVAAPPPPKDRPKPYGGPSVPPPVLGGGWVLLQFHDMTGIPRGWVTIEMKANETQTHILDSLIANLVKEPFEGSVTIEPHEIVTQLEVRSDDDLHHAFMCNWRT